MIHDQVFVICKICMKYRSLFKKFEAPRQCWYLECPLAKESVFKRLEDFVFRVYNYLFTIRVILMKCRVKFILFSNFQFGTFEDWKVCCWGSQNTFYEHSPLVGAFIFKFYQMWPKNEEYFKEFHWNLNRKANALWLW